MVYVAGSSHHSTPFFGTDATASPTTSYQPGLYWAERGVSRLFALVMEKRLFRAISEHRGGIEKAISLLTLQGGRKKVLDTHYNRSHALDIRSTAGVYCPYTMARVYFRTKVPGMCIDTARGLNITILSNPCSSTPCSRH